MNPKLLKNHRLMFVEDASEEGAGAPVEGQEPKGDDGKADPQEQEPKDGEPSEDDLPEWAKKELSRARGEAAKYRTERNTALDKLKDAKSPEDIEVAVQEYVKQVEGLERELARERVAREFSLPNELAERLRGDTEDELKADAKALQKFARPQRGGSDDPKGGLDPSTEPDNFDPKAEAARLRRAR